MRVHLLELDLMLGDWVAFCVKDEEAGTGCAIVDRADEDLVACLSILLARQTSTICSMDGLTILGLVSELQISTERLLQAQCGGENRLTCKLGF